MFILFIKICLLRVLISLKSVKSTHWCVENLKEWSIILTRERNWEKRRGRVHGVGSKEVGKIILYVKFRCDYLQC